MFILSFLNVFLLQLLNLLPEESHIYKIQYNFTTVENKKKLFSDKIYNNKKVFQVS